MITESNLGIIQTAAANDKKAIIELLKPLNDITKFLHSSIFLKKHNTPEKQLKESIQKVELLLDKYDNNIFEIHEFLKHNNYLKYPPLDWFQNQLWICSVIARKKLEICKANEDPKFFSQEIILRIVSFFQGLLQEIIQYKENTEKDYCFIDENGEIIHVNLTIDNKFRDFVKMVLEESVSSFIFGSEATEISKGSTTTIREDSEKTINAAFTEKDETSEKKYYGQTMHALRQTEIREMIYKSLVRLLNYEIRENSMTNPTYFVSNYNPDENLEGCLETFISLLKQNLNSCKNKKAYDTIANILSCYFSFQMEIFAKKTEYAEGGLISTYAEIFDNLLSKRKEIDIEKFKEKLEKFKTRYIAAIKEMLDNLKQCNNQTENSKIVTVFCQMTFPVQLNEFVSNL